MRILFSSSLTGWGGGEHWMLTTALGLRRRGHTVRLACAAGSEMGRRARTEGLPVDALHFHGDLDPALTWRYWRICRRHRIDLLCLNMDKVLRVAGPAARLAGAAVVPRRGSDFPLGSKPSHKFTYLRIANGVIVNSAATRVTMLSSAPWLPPDKIEVIYNGIDTGAYTPDPRLRAEVRAALGAGPETVVVGMIGELTTRKNHQLVVRELPALQERHPGLQIWIAGEGPERSTLTEIARRGGVADSLHLLGFRTDVQRLLQGMDIFCHPSLQEGFGYVIVEAMAAGLPVIVADASNMPELVTDGEVGFLCDPGDGSQWRRRILALLEDRALPRRLGEAGRRRVCHRFSLERMLDEVENYFLQILTR